MRAAHVGETGSRLKSMVMIDQQPFRQQSQVFQPAHGRVPPQAYPPMSRQMQHPQNTQPQQQQQRQPFTMEIHQQRQHQPSQLQEKEERPVLQQQRQKQPQLPTSNTPRASPASYSNEADAEAIMAAVAMTELFHSGSATAKESTQRENATPTSELTASLAKTDIGKIKRKPAQQQKQDSTNKKSKIVSSPLSPEDDEVRHAVSASQSFTSVESRNPSPGVQHQHQHPPTSSYYATAAPAPPARYPHPLQWVQHPPQPQRHQYHLIDGRYYTRGDPHGHRMIPAQTAYRASPPHPYYPTPPPDSDVGVGGLPKALSFRKICSHCGKTRGEHGELGFGHKCQYRDCGKCGADQRWHVSAGQPMGVACQLTVPQGALPGAAIAYERKIRDLATRAELQRVVRYREKEAATTTTTTPPPAKEESTAVVPPKTTSSTTTVVQ